MSAELQQRYPDGTQVTETVKTCVGTDEKDCYETVRTGVVSNRNDSACGKDMLRVSYQTPAGEKSVCTVPPTK